MCIRDRYYAQAWYLVNKGKNKRLFIGKFEAWVHGPVNREDVYKRQGGTRTENGGQDEREEYGTVDLHAERHGLVPVQIPG